MAGTEIRTSLVQDTVDCLAAAVPPGTRLIVFGSTARGDARDESDIDLLVVEPVVIDRFGEIARLSALLGRRLIPADVKVLSAEAFEKQKSITNTLAWRAVQEGQFHELAP